MTAGEGAAWGGLFGGIIGALLAAPFTAGASAAAAAGAIVAAGSLSGVALGATFGAIDAESWKDDYGISEDFVDRVGSMIQPGDSAVFVLARTINPDLVAEAFHGYGGTILRTTLNDAQRARVEGTLHAARQPSDLSKGLVTWPPQRRGARRPHPRSRRSQRRFTRKWKGRKRSCSSSRRRRRRSGPRQRPRPSTT